jgi:hypothetical protein
MAKRGEFRPIVKTAATRRPNSFEPSNTVAWLAMVADRYGARALEDAKSFENVIRYAASPTSLVRLSAPLAASSNTGRITQTCRAISHTADRTSW